MYIWEHATWPNLRWDANALARPLGDANLLRGRLLGRMEQLGFHLRLEAELLAMTEEAVNTAEIEGETLNRDSVRSSLARRLGLPHLALGPEDRRAEGMAAIALDASRNHAEPLTQERLFAWHAALFPTGRSGLFPIRIGAWRDDHLGPMQVVSGAVGRQRVHYQAPPADRLEAEIRVFLAFFNEPRTLDGIIHAALSHLWFVTIHPFDDGNGRIARSIADMSLARSEENQQRFYSLSAQIMRDRTSDYYDILEQTQKGERDITSYVAWFVDCFSRALKEADRICNDVLRKAEFWQLHADAPLNERQRKLLNRVLDGFDGNLTTRRWASMGQCSQPTAQRDIKELIDLGILVRNEGGSKNSSYRLHMSQT